jgi:mono/diheme cytochrome c family protein
MTIQRAGCLGLLVCAACSSGPHEVDDGASTTVAAEGEDRERERDDRPAVLSDVVPPPVMGGGLLVTADDAFAVISDPDRDLVHVVDLKQAVEVHAISVEPGDLPWRSVEDAAGRVHVVVRGGGAIVTIAPSEGEIVARHAVCADPRGIGLLEDGVTLVVACAGGELVTLSGEDGTVIEREDLGPDLRDVVVLDGEPWVTRFRAAKIGPAGEAWLAGSPVMQEDFPFSTQPGTAELHPNTAWRTLALPDGRWAMLHQLSTDRSLDVDPEDDVTSGGSEDGGSGGGAYGGGDDIDDIADPCSSVVQTAITVGDRHGGTVSSGAIDRTVLAVDVAASAVTTQVAIASGSGLAVVSLSDFEPHVEAPCTEPIERPLVEGDFIAVAFAGDGRLYAFSRQPAELWRIDLLTDDTRRMPLTGPKRLDTGHAIFHRDAGFGIACASCHPEGGDDGRVWQFSPIGPRHTPALDVGLFGTEPFHWAGEHETMGGLLDEVHARRMGAAPQSEERQHAFERFLFAMPVPAPVRTPDDASTRGRTVFEALGCATCHAGTALTTNETVEIGASVPLQIPTLSAIASHPPYMHDGRARDLHEAVWDMLARTRPRAEPTTQEIDDLVSYLRTL